MKKQKYAYQNRSLTDMKDEKWEAIRGYEEYYEVSNYGRVKALKKQIEFFIPGKHLVSYWKPEKILSQGISKQWNSFSKENIFRLTVTLCVNQKMKTTSVSRLVWNTFINKIDFKNDHLCISFKDGDGRNNHFDNLYSGDWSAISKEAYNRNRLINLTLFITEASIAKRGIARSKTITQYDLSGNRIKTYSSLKLAGIETGIQHGNISMAAKGKKRQMGGFIWRYGKGRKKIDTSRLLLTSPSTTLVPKQ